MWNVKLLNGMFSTPHGHVWKFKKIHLFMWHVSRWMKIYFSAKLKDRKRDNGITYKKKNDILRLCSRHGWYKSVGEKCRLDMIFIHICSDLRLH